jgi:hypothetical protein
MIGGYDPRLRGDDELALLFSSEFPARHSFWLGGVLSNDILSITRSAMRTFAGGNICAVGEPQSKFCLR